MKGRASSRPASSRAMFVRLVSRALVVRRRRMFLALLALAVGAALASALLSTYADLDERMAGELRGFGANLVITPRAGDSGATVREDALPAGAVQGFPTLPWLYVVGRVAGEPAVLAGTRFQALQPFSRAWQWSGRSPSAPAECAIGERLAAHFRLAPGSRLKAEYGGNAIDLRVTAVVTTGASEDHQVLMALPELQSLAGLPGRISLLQAIVPGTAAELEKTRARLAAALGAGAEARTLRQVAESSARVLLKVKWMLFAVTGLVLGIVALCVMTTLSAMVLERRKDIAVMKALGGNQRRITGLFLAEAATLALLGGAAGYLAGFWLAGRLAQAIFHAPVQWRPVVLPQVLLVTLVVGLVATLFPLRLVRGVEPAAILKGE